MKFRKAVETDINGIINIIRQAQAYFKEQGIDQWQNNYPNVETISCDIDNKSSIPTSVYAYNSYNYNSQYELANKYL